MAEHPRNYASFYDALDDELGHLKNDLGHSLTFTKEAAGDLAIMLVSFCEDPDLAEFVGQEWRGHADDLRYVEEYPPENEGLLDVLDQAPVSLDDLDEDDMTHARPAQGGFDG